MLKKTAVAALFGFAGFASSAIATPLTATEILQQFNVVVEGSIASTSTVQGRTYAGGAVAGGQYAQKGNNLPASAYAGLTAGGSVSGVHVNGKGAVVGGSISGSIINSGDSVVRGSAASSTFNGKAYVAGTTSGVNFNGGQAANTAATPAMQAAADAANSTNFAQVMDNLSQQLSLLTSTGSWVSISGNRATFNAVADATGLAVFDLTLIDTQLFGLGEFQFNLGSATAVIFNTDNSSYNISANFLGGSAHQLGSKAIWNFYNATSITTHIQFGGALLATDALLNNNQEIIGTVVVENLNQKGAILQAGFGGTLPAPAAPPQSVPEPSALLLMALAFCAMAWCVRSR